MDNPLPAAPQPGSGAPAVTKHFHFAKEDIAAHPCYVAGRARRRWTLLPSVMVLVALGLAGAAVLGKLTDLVVILPFVMIFLAEGIANLQFANECHTLRDRGILRDLCLTGQSPILALLAIRNGQWQLWRGFVDAIAILPMTQASPGGGVSWLHWICVVGFAAGCLMIAWDRERSSPHLTYLSRRQIVGAIGQTRHLRRAAVYVVALSALFVISIPALRPLIGGRFVSGLFCFLPAAALALAFLTIPAEQRLHSVPDAEFQAWVEEWCVGLTPASQ